jgi:hypothetical protein
MLAPDVLFYFLLCFLMQASGPSTTSSNATNSSATSALTLQLRKNTFNSHLSEPSHLNGSAKVRHTH